MDLSLIKSKLDSFQNKGQAKEKVDYSKIFWKPKVGKHQVRIVPSKFSTSTPFRSKTSQIRQPRSLADG
jgi:hypothetical protein